MPFNHSLSLVLLCMDIENEPNFRRSSVNYEYVKNLVKKI